MTKTRLLRASQAKAAAMGLALAAVAIAAGTPAQATTVFSTGFEPPGYSTGQLAGQAGWFNAPNAFVQTTSVESGLQGVSVDPGALGQHVTYHSTSYNSVGDPNQLVTISTDFMLDSLGVGAVWEALAAIGNGGFITQLLVLSDTGQVCGFNPCNGPTLTAGTWYNLSMELDYATGTVRDLVDGVEFSSGLFSNVPGHSTTLDFVGLGTNNTFMAGSTGKASWDNLSVVSSGAPEPAAWTMMLTGFAVLGGVIRRRKAASWAAS